jgi:serine/threonine protein kinase
MEHEKVPLSVDEILQCAEACFKQDGQMIQFDRSSIRLFSSKKHYVVKTRWQGHNVVVKYFNPKIRDYLDRHNREFENYKRLISQELKQEEINAFRMPQLIRNCPGALILEYCNGFTAEEMLKQRKLKEHHIIGIVRFLLFLHRQGLIFGDQRLKNIMVDSKGCIIPVDLEDIQPGSPLEDIGLFGSAFLDHHTGLFEGDFDNFSMAALVEFIKTYQKLALKQQISWFTKFDFENLDFWHPYLKNGLETVAHRRNKQLSVEGWQKIQEHFSIQMNIT